MTTKDEALEAEAIRQARIFVLHYCEGCEITGEPLTAGVDGATEWCEDCVEAMPADAVRMWFPVSSADGGQEAFCPACGEPVVQVATAWEHIDAASGAACADARGDQEITVPVTAEAAFPATPYDPRWARS